MSLDREYSLFRVLTTVQGVETTRCMVLGARRHNDRRDDEGVMASRRLAPMHVNYHYWVEHSLA